MELERGPFKNWNRSSNHINRPEQLHCTYATKARTGLMLNFDCLDLCLAKQDEKSMKSSTSSQQVALHAGSPSTGRQTTICSTSMERDIVVNPYHVLELMRDATPSEIQQSYRKFALLNHPGRGISSPEERLRKMAYFEILAASFETLMHAESRRRFDLRMKASEKRHRSYPYNSKLSEAASASTGRDYPRPLLELTASSSTTQSSAFEASENDRSYSHSHRDPTAHRLLQGEADNTTIPELLRASSSHSSSDGDESKSRSRPRVGTAPLGTVASTSETIISLSRIVGCTVPDISASISNEERKEHKSLMASSASLGSAEESEIQFTEATVNRLFGGPMASLHRAHNFEPFTDPYIVFEKVFGGPIFPRVEIEGIDCSSSITTYNSQSMNRNERVMVRPQGHPYNHPHPFHHSGFWEGWTHKDPDGLTTVFVSTRVVHNRKITRSETVKIDPVTGKATSTVTVTGEDLEPIPEVESFSLLAWLFCFGNSSTNGVPPPSSAIINDVKPSSQWWCFIPDVRSVYQEILDDCHRCNNDYFASCIRYMGCAQ